MTPKQRGDIQWLRENLHLLVLASEKLKGIHDLVGSRGLDRMATACRCAILYIKCSVPVDEIAEALARLPGPPEETVYPEDFNEVKDSEGNVVMEISFSDGVPATIEKALWSLLGEHKEEKT